MRRPWPLAVLFADFSGLLAALAVLFGDFSGLLAAPRSPSQCSSVSSADASHLLGVDVYGSTIIFQGTGGLSSSLRRVKRRSSGKPHKPCLCDLLRKPRGWSLIFISGVQASSWHPVPPLSTTSFASHLVVIHYTHTTVSRGHPAQFITVYYCHGSTCSFAQPPPHIRS